MVPVALRSLCSCILELDILNITRPTRASWPYRQPIDIILVDLKAWFKIKSYRLISSWVSSIFIFGTWVKRIFFIGHVICLPAKVAIPIRVTLHGHQIGRGWAFAFGLLYPFLLYYLFLSRLNLPHGLGRQNFKWIEIILKSFWPFQRSIRDAQVIGHFQVSKIILTAPLWFPRGVLLVHIRKWWAVHAYGLEAKTMTYLSKCGHVGNRQSKISKYIG